MYENDLQKFIIDPATSIKNHQSPDYPYLAHPSNLFEEKRKKEIKSEERNETKIFPSNKKKRIERNNDNIHSIPRIHNNRISDPKFFQIHSNPSERGAQTGLKISCSNNSPKNDHKKRHSEKGISEETNAITPPPPCELAESRDDLEFTSLLLTRVGRSAH